MRARYPGTCAHCAKPIPKDTEMHYVSATKKAYHPACANTGPERPEPDTADDERRNEQFRRIGKGDPYYLSDSLGFIEHESAMVADWRSLCAVLPSAGESAGRTSGAPRGELGPLFGMREEA